MSPSTHSLSLAAAVYTLLPLAHGLGCYTNGGLFGSWTDGTFAFKHLHSHPSLYSNEMWINQRDIVPEVYADIATHCSQIAGNTPVVSKAETWWTACSDWAYTDKDNDCVIGCYGGGDGCGEKHSGDEITTCVVKCINACPIVEQKLFGDDSGNHLNWEMAHDGHGDEARTLSYEVCVAGFKNVHDSCEHGGEMESGGFWFKLDPNTRSCDNWQS
jgi:hypothetical protein